MPIFLLCKNKIICYNSCMEKKQTDKLNTWLRSPTISKGAGIAFSIATCLPSMLMALVVGVCVGFGFVKTDAFQYENWYIYVAYLCTPIALALAAVVFFRFNRQSPALALKKQKCQAKYYLIALLMQAGLVGLSELNNIFLQFLSKFGYQDPGITLPSMDGFGFVGVIFVIAVLPAVFEELFFRGILLNGLKSVGETGAILLCGALFSLFHQNPAQTIYQFCCGAAYAWVALRAGSILPTVIAHFINNAAILTLYKFNITLIPVPISIIIMCVSALCLAGAIVWLIALKKRQENPKITMDKAEKKNFFLGAALGIVVCVFSWLITLVSGLIGG